jgi:hypothetical protein
MTLQNLLAIKLLTAFKPNNSDIARLLSAAKRNLADARVEVISDQNRFDAAYKCIMQCAMAALWANGFRTATNQPGHHQTAIQALQLTIGLESRVVVTLDALRKQRNVTDYSGDLVSPTLVKEGLAQASSLLQRVESWLASHRPELL